MRPTLVQRTKSAVLALFSASSYPFPPGAQNRDGFERNADNPLRGCSNEDRALTISTFWACVRLLSGTVASLPCNVFERPKGSGRPEIAFDYALQTILHDQANAETTAFSLIQAVVASLAVHGEAYGEKRFVGNRLVAVDFLPRNRVTRVFENDEWRYYFANRDGTRREIPRAKLWRILGFSLDGVCGLSVVQYGARNLNSAMSAEIAASSTFEKGLMPTTYFKYPKILQKNQREDARKAIKIISGALNAGEPAILEADMETGTIGIDPVDAQLLESRAWSVEEICRWFGMDPSMIGHSQKQTSWGTGLEQRNLAFLTYCIQTIIKSIEASIRMDLIPAPDRQRYFAKFSLEGLLRADSAGRAALYASAAQNGWMSRAEIRELEDLPFVAGSDVLTAQSNLLPLTKLGQAAPAAAAANDAIKAWLGITEQKGTA